MAENDSIRRALSRGMKTLMSQKAFDRITVSDICRASAVSRRTFYRYFQDKYDLLNFVHYDEFSRFFEDKQTAHALEIYPAACRHMYENRMFYVNAFSVTGQGSFREFCMERLYVYLERDYGSACETDHERRFYLSRILDAVFDAVQDWLRQEPCMPPEEYVEKTLRSITRFSSQFARIAQQVAETQAADNS